MKNLTDINRNDRTYSYYYASYRVDSDLVTIIPNMCKADELEGIDGFTVYGINPDNTVYAIADGGEKYAKWLCLLLINNDLRQDSLNEAIADIAHTAGLLRLVTHNSRNLMDYVVEWAKEFEKNNEGVNWGVDSEKEYIEAIDDFARAKVNECIAKGLGYIYKYDNQSNASEDDKFIVCWMKKRKSSQIGSVCKDKYIAFDNINKATAKYNKLIDKPGTYSANVCKVIKSTDY